MTKQTKTQPESEFIKLWKEEVKKCKKFEIFCAIKYINQVMEMNREMSEEMILENRKLMKITKSRFQNFGVNQESEYQKWYEHWDTWENTIDKEFEKKYANKTSIDEFLQKRNGMSKPLQKRIGKAENILLDSKLVY